MSGQELIELQSHYYWFYSTIAQSLSALIGIVGLFAIFRIQMLVNIIESKTKDLQLLVNQEQWQALGVLTSTSIKENISVSIQKIVNQLLNSVSQYDNMIKQNIKNTKNQQTSANSTNDLQANRQKLTDRINELMIPESAIIKLKTIKHKITHSAKILIAMLIALLIGSIICLSLVKIICQSLYWSKALIPLTMILLSSTLYLLGRLCWISLKTDQNEVIK